MDLVAQLACNLFASARSTFGSCSVRVGCWSVVGEDTIFTGSGDVNGIFREAGIPLRQTLSVDNGLFWEAARLRPDLFLSCQWGVALLTPEGRSDGDRAKSAMTGIHPTGPHYELVKRIESKDQKVV